MRQRADSSDNEQEEDEEADKAEVRAAAKYISWSFCEPLETKNACLASLNDEVDEVVVPTFWFLAMNFNIGGYRAIC